jgi:2-oxoacid:acceptor oxidoreductase delta subunit (pyruvate/2-ketoisovalerate family)
MVKIRIHKDREGAWSDAGKLLLCLDTGAWRAERPALEMEKCNYCGLCALYCPTQCLEDQNDHFRPNLDFCKGCGICARECPRKAIEMVPEGDQ